jgi:CHRD domain
VSGRIAAFLCGGGDKPSCPTPGGTVTGVIDADDIIGPTGQGIEPGSFEEVVRAISAGATYANVHTNRWPGGEIRGQIADSDSDDGK